MRQRILAAMCIAASSAAIAFAQARPAPGYPGMDAPGTAGQAPMTRGDAETRTVEHFAMLDGNHDGAVTRDEIAAAQRSQRDRMRGMIEAHVRDQRERAFDRLDANKDGSISRAEFAATASPPPDGSRPDRPGDAARMAMRGAMGARGGPGGHGAMPGRMAMAPGPMLSERWFERADANHDNKVTLAEAKASALARFDARDTNHDGTIDREERRMAFRGRMIRGAPLPPPGDMPSRTGG